MWKVFAEPAKPHGLGLQVLFCKDLGNFEAVSLIVKHGERQHFFVVKSTYLFLVIFDFDMCWEHSRHKYNNSIQIVAFMGCVIFSCSSEGV